MGVDNAIVEMDANEPPIADGSSLPFVELIKKAGLQEQAESRRVFEVREPLHLESRDGSLLTIVPDKKFRISCTHVGPQGRTTQFYSTEINPAIYEKEIAPARTFVFYEDIAPLLEKGLIKGGTLESAVVIRGDTALSKHPLRFADEFVRHKILDIDWRPHALRPPHHGPRHRRAARPRPEHRARPRAAQDLQRNARDGAARVQPSQRRGRDGHQRGDGHPAAPLSLPAGGPHHRLRGRDQVHRREERHHQRAVLPGPLSRPSHHARRAATRGHGPGRRPSCCCARRKTRARSATSSAPTT